MTQKILLTLSFPCYIILTQQMLFIIQMLLIHNKIKEKNLWHQRLLIWKREPITCVHAASQKTEHFVMAAIRGRIAHREYLRQKKNKPFIYAPAANQEMPLSATAATSDNEVTTGGYRSAYPVSSQKLYNSIKTAKTFQV